MQWLKTFYAFISNTPQAATIELPIETTVRSNRYEELDALRGISALLVVLFHFTMRKPDVGLSFDLGTSGVDLFFMISGLVIFMSLSRTKSSVDFVVNRLSRLYPTYWFAVTFTFILSWFAISYKTGELGSIDVMRYLANLTMFQFYFNKESIDGTYWTMIIVLLFYFSILLLFHFKKLKYINVIGISLSGLMVIMTSYFYDFYLVQWVVKWMPVLQFVPLFFSGTILYNILANKTRRIDNYLMLLFCLVCQILLFQYAGRSSSFITQGEYAMMLFIYFGLLILFVNDKLKFIVTRGTVFLGKISYALFLIHQFISIHVIIPFLTKEMGINFWIASVCIALPITIILATFITYTIEIPYGKKLKEALLAKTSKGDTYILNQEDTTSQSNTKERVGQN